MALLYGRRSSVTEKKDLGVFQGGERRQSPSKCDLQRRFCEDSHDVIYRRVQYTLYAVALIGLDKSTIIAVEMLGGFCEMVH